MPWGVGEMWPTQQHHLQLLPTQLLLPYYCPYLTRIERKVKTYLNLDHAIVFVNLLIEYFLMKDFALSIQNRRTNWNGNLVNEF